MVAIAPLLPLVGEVCVKAILLNLGNVYVSSTGLIELEMLQPPMISSPLKQTNEIDWIPPLKNYIRQTYGDDPERYAEECNTLNRLRQDMRGAGKDSTAGRDLLYRYYGQLELLDLRFPVDENHIKISFTWCVSHDSTDLIPMQPLIA